MKLTQVLILPGLLVGMATTLTAQSSQPREPAIRQAGAADQVLIRQVGRWNTVVTVHGAPGNDKMYKAISTSTLGCAGRCLIWELRSEMPDGQPFDGHGIEVFDPVARKYVATWTDATSSGFTSTSYTYDAAANTFEGTFQAKNSHGVPTTMNLTGDFKDPKKRVTIMTTAGTNVAGVQQGAAQQETITCTQSAD
jgi:hypothetical protein